MQNLIKVKFNLLYKRILVSIYYLLFKALYFRFEYKPTFHVKHGPNYYLAIFIPEFSKVFTELDGVTFGLFRNRRQIYKSMSLICVFFIMHFDAILT